MLLIRRYGTKFLWMTTGEKVRFMRSARWAAVRVKSNGPGWSWPYYGSDELDISPLSVEKEGWGGDGERLGAPNEL
jgi:hypothetical protein